MRIIEFERGAEGEKSIDKRNITNTAQGRPFGCAQDKLNEVDTSIPE